MLRGATLILTAWFAFAAAASGETVVVRLADRRTAVTIIHDGREERITARTPLPRRFPASDSLLGFDHRLWRGELIVESSGAAGLTVLNRLPLEDYLKGVVPVEMPANWPLEALKAQAVAARSFALGRLHRRRGSGFPPTVLQATVADQVYRGASAEAETSSRAVRETRGEYLEYAGAPLTAYFHSACGGVAERPAEVWRSSSFADERWLAASAEVFANAPDEWCGESPHRSWRLVVAVRDLEAALRHLTPIRRIEQLEVRERSLSGRAAVFTLTGRTAEGRRATRSVDGQRLRMAIGPDRLRSLLLDLFRDGDRYVFFGRGWGHGVGLCQWGARGRAAAGQSYREILAAYYPGARLIRMELAPLPEPEAAPPPLLDIIAYPNAS